MTSRITVEGGARLEGTVPVPGDKSISHRALMLAARATGPSRLENLSPGADVESSACLARALGARLAGREAAVSVEPAARRIVTEREVDCGNSGTTMRLGAGLVAAWPGTTHLYGDDSLSRRPMARVVEPLRAMGARVQDRDGRPPLEVMGSRLRGGEHRLTVASAQVKSAILLAALEAEGPTTVFEPTPTRAHTEEMLIAAGVEVERVADGVRVAPGPSTGLDMRVPGDPSAAVFWLVAATLCPESELRVEGVYSGPGRDGYRQVLARMGASVEASPSAAGSGAVDLVARHRALTGTVIDDPAEVAACIDELPALMVAAAAADGVTELRNAAELRVKESDRILAIAGLLHAMGIGVEVHDDGLTVQGGRLRGAVVDSGGDHRIAMAAAVAGLAAGGTTTVTGWEAVAVSHPRFAEDLASVRIR